MPDARIPIYTAQQPRLGSSAGVPIREDAAYTNTKGKEKGGICKRTEKTIEKLQDHLRRVLEPQEVIFCTTRAQLPVTSFEQLVLGWLASVTDSGILILTNRRLLFFLVKRDGSWKRSLRSVRWGDIETAKVSTFLGTTIKLRYRDGSEDRYWRLRSDDARRVREMFKVLVPAGTAEHSPAQGRVHLCPQCLGPLTARSYQCTNCGQSFKDEKTMIRRAWMFPGAVYFYSGHPGLGILDFVIEAGVVIEILYWCGAGLGLVPPQTNPGEAPLTAVGAFVGVAIMAVLLVGKKLLTVRHCRRFIREFVPIQQGAVATR